jgi:hypothetical protein
VSLVDHLEESTIMSQKRHFDKVLTQKICSIVLPQDCANGDLHVSLLGNSQTLEFMKNRFEILLLGLLLFVRL